MDMFEAMAIQDDYPLDRYPAHTTLPDHMAQPDIILAFCAEEVRRQGDSPWHVYRMMNAWYRAIARHKTRKYITHDDIKTIGAHIDELNEKGYRKYNVKINQDERPFKNIFSDLSALLEKQKKLSADDWYYEFETIHPFGDGNGRTGKVLYNWLNGSLDNPVWPKNFWGNISNP